MINIVPVNDWIEHKEATTCICEPDIIIENGEMVIVHNAADGRE